MEVFKKISKYLLNILIGILILICVSSLVATTIFRKTYINLFGYTFFIVSSGSMGGTIDVNDMVIVKVTKDIKVDDIVTYKRDGYFITHRVISTNNDQIITKGDVNATEDTPVDRNTIIGKVVSIFPFATIFKVIGAAILIAIIVIVFNFETIFQKYIFKRSFTTFMPKKKKTLSEYNLSVQQILAIIKKRNDNVVKETMDSIWVVRLRYITKSSELYELKKYDLLKQLINGYKMPEKIYQNIFSESLMQPLRGDSCNNYFVLLLNTIIYEDKEAFDILFLELRDKVNKEF